jgi:hypothetical protein
VNKRQEFLALYQGLLSGLNLVQQKTWQRIELEKYFPDLREHWEPLLAARHSPLSISAEKYRALAQLETMLLSWDDPVEASLLKRRLAKIDGYFQEVEKTFCDEQSLQFFLQDLPLLEAAALGENLLIEVAAPRLSSSEAAVILDQELKKLFPSQQTQTVLSHGTLARASTTKTGIRLREDATFTREELETLTVHEAWVHLGSNLAGAVQKELPWLASWHPGVTGFQEGLALIAEIVTGHWHGLREAQVLLRHQAALLALKGENARQVWSFLRGHALNDVAALEMTLRVFRGCDLAGGMAFGKEFQYVLGLHQWLVRRPLVTIADMRLALAGKMDFLEWEILRSTHLKEKIHLPHPPEALLDWAQSPRLSELTQRLHFKKVA